MSEKTCRVNDYIFQPNSVICEEILTLVKGDTFFKDLLRYLLTREGVYGPGRPALLANAMQRKGSIVGHTAYG